METIDTDRAEYVAFDLETTGLSAETDRIVEIGAVRFDAEGAVLGEFQRLVNPLRPSGPQARAVHGISDAELALAETAEVVLPEFLGFLGDPAVTTLLAHNASFDAGFLGRELARRLGLDPDGPHRALADARRVRGLWLALQAEGDEAEAELQEPLAYPIFDANAPWPAPRGWQGVEEAIGLDRVVLIEYVGGTRGPTPRRITPRRFANRGGVAYLVALCHLDLKEKEFRLDRVRRFEVVDASLTP